MSFPQYVEDMERPTTGGSIKRARERAEAGVPRESFEAFARRMAQGGNGAAGGSKPELQPQRPQQPRPAPQPPQQQQPRSQIPQLQQRLPPPRPPQPVAPAPAPAPKRPAGDANAGSSRIPILRPQGKDGQVGVSISRPTQVPQWPLAGPVSANPADGEPYRPPPGKSQPPQRPPRPSRVPSILDGSKIQDHTPVFQYQPQTGRESELSIPQTTSSRGSNVSSVGSIPDFPMPAPPPPIPMAPPRRSVNLGPPPSSRRGASSFYSNASYVSPIPEESPRTRSHTSYASSTAMPESWGTPSPGQSPKFPGEVFYEDIQEEGRESVYDEEGDESRLVNLVRSASIGKRGKATLVESNVPVLPPPTWLGAPEPGESSRPGPSPVQGMGAFMDGTGYVEGSSSSSASAPTYRQPRRPDANQTLTMDSIMNAFDAASSTDAGEASRRLSISPLPMDRPYDRWLGLKKPPRLDIDSVKKEESRGSLTSLPDLIRRATQLAASLDKGRRPSSRFDVLNYSPNDALDGRDGDKELSVDYEKHQSGLSDMLAAFPPPAQERRSWRQSLRDQVGSWPLPINSNYDGVRRSNQRGAQELDSSSEGTILKQRRRRCCGMPMWGFVVVVIVVLILIAAATVIPLEFFVIRKQNVDAAAQSALTQCQGQLTCANGGTNVVSDRGFCSCICTNGFTGFDCTVAGTNGCATANLDQPNGDDIRNVTLGDAIPRLIGQAQTNFSIPLSGTQILAKFNAASLSCAAENALVTFDGSAIRRQSADAEVFDTAVPFAANAAVMVDGFVVETVTIQGRGVAVTLAAAAAFNQRRQFSTIVSAPTTFDSSGFVSVPSTPPPRIPPTTTTTITVPARTSQPAAPVPQPSATFVVTEQTLDFARVAVLLVLQTQTLQTAESAQMALQRFFAAASQGARGQGAGVGLAQARNLTLGGANSVDLVGLLVDVGAGLQGRGVARRRALVVGAGVTEGPPVLARGGREEPPAMRGFEDFRLPW